MVSIHFYVRKCIFLNDFEHFRSKNPQFFPACGELLHRSGTSFSLVNPTYILKFSEMLFLFMNSTYIRTEPNPEKSVRAETRNEVSIAYALIKRYRTHLNKIIFIENIWILKYLYTPILS